MLNIKNCLLTMVVAATMLYGTTVSIALAQEQNHVVLIVKGQHKYWKAVEQGAQRAAEQYHVTLSVKEPKDETQVEQQLDMLKEAIAQKPAAICLAAIDAKSTFPYLKEAYNNDIALIGIDSGVPNAPIGTVKATASTNNVVAGALAAQEIFTALMPNIVGATADKPVRIVIFTQDHVSESMSSRTRGFIFHLGNLVNSNEMRVEGPDKFAKDVEYPKVIIEVIEPKDASMEAKVATATEILAKHDLIAVFANAELTSNALIEANHKMSRLGPNGNQVFAIGFDAGEDLVNAVRHRVFAGAITQNPIKMGFEAIRLAVDASHNQGLIDVDTGVMYYTHENMDMANIKACLY